MSWVRLDDAVFRNKKFMPRSPSAKLLHLAAICHCAELLTDGEIEKTVFPELAARAGARPKHALELVAAALWHDHGDRWMVNDYLVYNPPRSKVLAEREAARLRKENWRQSHRDGRRGEQGDEHPPPGTPPTNGFTTQKTRLPEPYVPVDVPDALPRAELGDQVRAAKQHLTVVEIEARAQLRTEKTA